mmetsp:Transcript_9207/g.19897  ORF Transcript_9207/g.19897 Transcript_9207/m.19897 type:complete len:229 (-) Transcript_9207:3972-4658(-)
MTGPLRQQPKRGVGDMVDRVSRSGEIGESVGVGGPGVGQRGVPLRVTVADGKFMAVGCCDIGGERYLEDGPCSGGAGARGIPLALLHVRDENSLRSGRQVVGPGGGDLPGVHLPGARADQGARRLVRSGPRRRPQGHTLQVHIRNNIPGLVQDLHTGDCRRVLQPQHNHRRPLHRVHRPGKCPGGSSIPVHHRRRPRGAVLQQRPGRRATPRRLHDHRRRRNHHVTGP